MKQHLVTLLMAGLLGWTLAGCADSIVVGKVNTDTGLSGQAFLEAPCPVITEDPCPDVPLQATFDVFDSGGRRLAQFRSDSNGFFQVFLPPGDYTIIPTRATPIISPTAQHRTAQVGASGLTALKLLFDSGIR